MPHATCRMTRRSWREADKSADMVEMEESEQVGVGASAGEGQDKDVVLNRVEQQPVTFDVAITESGQVSSECMVMILRRQGLPGCKDADHCFKLGHIGAPLEHLLQFLSEFLGANDVVFHDSRNSLNFAGSLQRGVVGSCAMRLASSKASSVSSRGVFLRPSLKETRDGGGEVHANVREKLLGISLEVFVHADGKCCCHCRLSFLW